MRGGRHTDPRCQERRDSHGVKEDLPREEDPLEHKSWGAPLHVDHGGVNKRMAAWLLVLDRLLKKAGMAIPKKSHSFVFAYVIPRLVAMEVAEHLQTSDKPNLDPSPTAIQIRRKLSTHKHTCAGPEATTQPPREQESSAASRSAPVRDKRVGLADNNRPKASDAWHGAPSEAMAAAPRVVRLRAGDATTLRSGPDDHVAPALAALHAACIERDATVAHFLPPLDLAAMARWWQARIDEIGTGAREIFVVLEEGPAAGPAVGGRTTAPPTPFVAGVVALACPPSQTGPFRGLVEKLLVSPDRRKLGIGRALMAELERVALDRDRWLLLLDTEVGSAAEVVYPRLGYTAFGGVPDYLVSPKDGRLIASMNFYKDLRKSGTLDGQVYAGKWALT